MTKAKKSGLCLGASVLTLMLATTGAALAQDAATDDSQVEEVIVTALRRSQNIQDVPMNVTAITGSDLAENNIVKFEDLDNLAPGLDLRVSSQGAEASLRGVSTVTVSGGPPAVDVYFNESPLNGLIAFRSIYDIGQIEVLRGPQGTLRGDTAPTGAITLATRRPYFNDWGVSTGLIVSDRERVGGSADVAVNIPVIDDKLAVRIAGFYDLNDNGGTRNPVTGAEAEQKVSSIRGSMLFQPTEDLEIFAMYQHLRDESESLARLDGAGVGYNGPAISGEDNLSAQERVGRNQFDARVGSIVTKWDLGPATANYVGGYRKQTQFAGPGDQNFDPGNAILNYDGDLDSTNSIQVTQWTHELRLDSEGSDRFWDYTVGAYHSSSRVDVLSHNPQVALPGAFGDPGLLAGSPPSGPVNGRYVLYLDLNLYEGDNKVYAGGGNTSIFASSTFNFPTGTHLRVGARHIWATQEKNFVLGLSDAFVAASIGIPTAGLCPFIIPGSVDSIYATACDIPLAASNLFDIHVQREHTAWVYDVNLRQDITDDIMVYAGFNHNWRGPGISQGNVPPQYVLVDPETSDNYEVGFKADFLDRRVRVTAAAFQQDFEDYNATVSNVPFLDGTGTVVDAFSITYNGDAVVRGFEADVDTRITDQWSLRASVAYAKGEFKNALQPCRDANFDGVPDGGTPTALGFTAAGVNIATCPTNGRINGLPEWSYTVQSEYAHPLSQGEAYVRGLYNWRSEGQIVSSAAPIESYGTLDVYVGVRDIVDDLDVNVFVKNAFDEIRLFDQGGELTTFGFGSGYRSVFYTPGREIGVSVRKTFGGG